MSRAARVFFVLCMWAGAEVNAGPQGCEILVASEQSTRPGTDDSADFIGYLGQLLENQIIGTEELTRLQDSLERGTLVNPIAEQDAELHSRLLVHRDGLQERIERSEIDPVRVLSWVREQLGDRERVRVRRDETREESRDAYQKMIFHRVEPGTFQMGEDGKFLEIKITKPFDLMSTPVTQKQWAEVLGENPAEFKDGAASIVLVIGGNPVRMQPNHPVEQVSWEDAQNFIQKLNDLSQKGSSLLSSLIPDHRKGDQFRLPTEAEWEFVAKNRGRANGRYFFGDREESLREYAWFENNSEGSTHPVGDLKPLLVDGNAFYDLHGNVWEWAQDKWEWGLRYGKKLTDPTGPKTGSDRVLRGGCWDNDAMRCRSAWRNYDSPGLRTFSFGFRLVRISHE